MQRILGVSKKIVWDSGRKKDRKQTRKSSHQRREGGVKGKRPEKTGVVLALPQKREDNFKRMQTVHRKTALLHVGEEHWARNRVEL